MQELLLAAVLPSILLIVYIYRKDRVEKEPIGMLLGLFVLGGLTTISALVLELGAGALLSMIAAEDSLFYIAVENFLIVALAEEGGKYFVLKKRTWKSREFNYTFDAVVYAVVVSLGFATVENILYVLNGDMTTAILRGVLSVPSHAIDAVFMGSFFGVAKYFADMGSPRRRNTYLRLALVVPVLTHGFYDFCLTADAEIFIWLFLIYEIVITILAFRQVRKLSRQDRPMP